MYFEIVHKTRECDQAIISQVPSENPLINKIKIKSVDFIQKRFKFKFMGSYISEGYTVVIIEAPSEDAVKKMVKIGTPIFTKLTGEKFEELTIREACFHCFDKFTPEIKEKLEEFDKKYQRTLEPFKSSIGQERIQ